MPYIGQGLTEGRRRAYNFVATGGQTTFSATYDVGYVDVFQNGILLTSSDYTATNGTTIVLGVGASASDEITIIAHQIFSVSDTVSASQGGTFSNNIDVTGNITTTGSVRGPSSFTIDPATHGDNTGTVIIAGDLTVNGTTTTINSTTLTVDDKNIIIASGSSNSSTADGSGLTVDLGSDGTATMTYTHATTSFNFNKQIRGTGANFTEAVTFNGNNYNIAFYNTSNAIKFFDNAKAQFGTGGDLEIRHNGNHSLIKDTGTGQLRISSDVVHLMNSDNSESMVKATENGAVELYHNNVKKLETTSSGATVTGTTYSSLNLGIRISSPAYNLHVHQDDSDASYALFTNTTTGTTANDGFRIGIDSNESALIWHREAEDIIFATSNDEKMRINSSGNVGIGTNNPASPLHVQADGIAIRVDGTGNTTRSLFFRNTTFSNPAQIYADGSLRLRTEDASTAIIFNTNSTGTNNERMRINSSGNVGINTNNPAKRLHIHGDSTVYPLSLDSTNTDYAMEFQRNGNSEWWLKASSSKFQIHENGVGDSLTVNAGGNVGIGTNNPGARLHILNVSGAPAVNTNDTDPLIRLGTADGVHGGIDLHATQKYSTLRSTVYRTTSSNSFGFGYNGYNMGTIDVGRVDQGYTWNGTNGNGEYTGGVQQQPRYMRKACFSGQIIANNTYYTIAENMSESRFTIECFCGDASSRDYKKYVGYYTSQAYGVYGLTQVIHMNGGWNSGGFDMRVSVPNGNLSIDLRFSSYYNSSNIASWMCIYTSFV